jgi:hypothetical protein
MLTPKNSSEVKFGSRFFTLLNFLSFPYSSSNPIHRRQTYSHLFRNRLFRQTVCQERQYFIALLTGSRLPPFKLPLRLSDPDPSLVIEKPITMDDFKLPLRLSDPDPLRLALQHHLPVKLGNHG